MKRKHIGKEIGCIANKIKREVGKIKSIETLDELSGTNGFIIEFIAKSDKPVYQRDIEIEFGITRSTASKVISLMEKKQLIIRRKVENDARLNQLILTEKAIVLNKNVNDDLIDFEEKLLTGFSSDEIDNLYYLLGKLKNNI